MIEDQKTNDAKYELGDNQMTFFGYQKVGEKEKKRLIQEQFNLIARKYDLMNNLLSCGLHHFWRRSAIRMLNIKKKERIVDLCGGTADLSILAAKATSTPGLIVLCDMNRAMIEFGRRKVIKALLSNKILFIQGDTEQLPMEACQFDAAIVGFGVRNLTRMEKGLREMYRILKPQGRLVSLEFARPTMPIFSKLYDMYSFFIMPNIGAAFSGSRQAYKYLAESIRMFPSPEEFAFVLQQIGFCNIKYQRLFFGIAAIHFGIKGEK